MCSETIPEQAARRYIPGSMVALILWSLSKTAVPIPKAVHHKQVFSYTAEQIEEALHAMGFSKIKTVHHKSKPWITVLAKKGA